MLQPKNLALYGYAHQNPAVLKDPTRAFVGVDDAAEILAGLVLLTGLSIKIIQQHMAGSGGDGDKQARIRAYTSDGLPRPNRPPDDPDPAKLAGEALAIATIAASQQSSKAPGAAWLRQQATKPTTQGVLENEITTYRSFDDRSPVGDRLEGHELWQHANLNELDLATERLSTPASQQNPVIALRREIHLRVGAAQRTVIPDPRNMTPLQNIRANANLLRDLNAAPPNAIDELERRAIAHARSLGCYR